MPVVRRVLTVVALATLAFSIVGPAAASPAADRPAWACTPDELAAAAGPSATRDRSGVARADSPGQLRERDTGQAARDLPREAKGRAPSTFSE